MMRNILISLGLFLTFLVKAGDYHESQIASQLAEGREPGELIQLVSVGAPFIGLYSQPSANQAQGAIILLHHMGGHPDWPQVVNPLRVQMAERGWAVLSIQMPILEPGEPIADYGKTVEQARTRIDVAVQHLVEQGHENIIIAGYSFGAALAVDYLATTKRTSINALVGISMQTQPFLSPRLELLEQLAKIRVPVLDIYGSRDFDSVIKQADARKSVVNNAGNADYHRRVIEAADHYFSGLEAVLSSRIHGWLTKLVLSPEVVAN